MLQFRCVKTYFLGLTVCFCVHIAAAQIVIGAPSLGFSQACANDTFNTFSVSFVFSPEAALESSNQFVIEMSDAEGDFSNPQIVYTSESGSVNTSPATLEFSLPQDTGGENYRLRIRSTAPAATSTGSIAFAAYYKVQDSPFTINNLVSTGAYCSGGSYLLTIDNPGTGNNDSPLAYPSLTFNWFRETGPTTSVFVAEGSSLEVSQEGTYFVETDYGTCTSNSFSNRVTITEASSGQATVTISSSLGNPYCPEQGLTTLSTIGGNNYQWFKDGTPIEDAITQTYQTDESGVFTVQVDLGNCQATGSIDLQSQLFEANINVLDIVELQDGETIDIVITDDAISPEYEWYLDNELLIDVTGSAYNASEIGIYTVVITETAATSCRGSREFDFEIIEQLDPFPDVENIPNVISPNGDGINDTWSIPQRYVSGTNTNIEIYTSQGEQVFRTNDYQNNWPQTNLNVNQFSQVYYYIITPESGKTKKGTITVLR